ncbi:hypothetical protein K502DRAFT_367908 [Neoconidiobolus thromboides FSU 785]|nr:hypothetical protein K502DRAFT_367908 [Neoconidiobolus thromboides FSU 785]
MELSTSHRSPSHLNRPVISSPLLPDVELARSNTVNYSPKPTSHTVIRRPRANVRRSQTISQVFDLSPLDNLSSSPMATAIFANNEKPLATKTFLNRHLKNKTSQSSLSLSRSPSIREGKEGSKEENGGLKVEIAFLDMHASLQAEYCFERTKPLVHNGRYLLKRGLLKLKKKEDFPLVYIFLFSDCLVYGTSPDGQPQGLTEQKIFNFMDLKLDSNLAQLIVEGNTFSLTYHDEILTFEATDREECERWVMVIQSGITFHCTLSQRKAKEVSISTAHSRKNSISSLNSVLNGDKLSRRSSFYNSLKELVGTFI